MIEVRTLAKSFQGVAALSGVSFAVRPGELFALLGPNGAGKTTTIRILTGLCRPDGGQALVAGAPAGSPQAKRATGVVAQTLNLDMELTVAQNLDIHGRLFAMRAPDRRRRAAEMLDRVGLSDRSASPVKTLSGGLKRRVMLARALMHGPRALFLDEPTVGLDADIRRGLWALFKEQQAGGAALVLTTHYIEEAEFLADRVAFLKAGAITALDTPQNLIDAVGRWAVTDLAGRTASAFFESRERAMAHAAGTQGGVTVRPTSLEDAYLRHMGQDKGAGCTGEGAGEGRANTHDARHGNTVGAGHGASHGGAGHDRGRRS